jgi:hypothetical protein
MIFTELLQEIPAKRDMKVQNETSIFMIPINTKSDGCDKNAANCSAALSPESPRLSPKGGGRQIQSKLSPTELFFKIELKNGFFSVYTRILDRENPL